MSSARLPELDPAHLSRAQRELADAITSGPRRHSVSPVSGPFGVWMHAPHVGLPAQSLGATLRYGTALPEDVRELVICTVGGHFRSRFEFAAHSAMAFGAGIGTQVIEALRTGGTPTLEGACADAWAVTRALLDQHRIPDTLYARAVTRFGAAGMVELVSIVGYYSMICLTLNSFDVPLPDGMVDPFPDGP